MSVIAVVMASPVEDTEAVVCKENVLSATEVVEASLAEILVVSVLELHVETPVDDPEVDSVPAVVSEVDVVESPVLDMPVEATAALVVTSPVLEVENASAVVSVLDDVD